jgi:hypothetical protein
MNYQISTGEKIDIKNGDWVDLISGLFAPDEQNGTSYMVENTLDGFVEILVKLEGDNYSLVTLSPDYICANYRRVES